MREILVLSLIVAISLSSSAIIEDCNPKFDALIQMHNFQPMIVQYACAAIFPEDNCPLEDPMQARRILGELEKMLINGLPILRATNPMKQIPLDSSYLNSPEGAATLTCFYGQPNILPKCIRGADANNVVSNILPAMYQYNSSLFNNKEYDPNGRHLITLDSSSESDWIQVVNTVKAKYGSIADIHIEANEHPLVIRTRSGCEYSSLGKNMSAVISEIESVLTNEISPTNVIDLKYGEKLKSVVAKDKPVVLQLYDDTSAEIFIGSSIKLFNFLSRVYDPDQIVFVRAFIPYHMPLLFEYAHWYYHGRGVHSPIIFFPRGYNNPEKNCGDIERKYSVINHYTSISEESFVQELANNGFDKRDILDHQWKRSENILPSEIGGSSGDNTLRIYYRGYRNRILSLEERDALRRIQSHFNQTQQIEFIDTTRQWIKDYEEQYLDQMARYDLFIFTATNNGKVVDRFVTNQIESAKIIQFVRSAAEDIQTIWWSIYSLWDDFLIAFDTNFGIFFRKAKLD